MVISHKTKLGKEIKSFLNDIGRELSSNDEIAHLETGEYVYNDELWLNLENDTFGDYQLETKAKIQETVATEDNIFVRRKTWTDVPDELKVDSSRVGCRVWVAGVERTANLTLDRIFKGGKAPYPVDTVILQDKARRKIPFYLNSVVLHPKNFTPKEVKQLFDASVVGEKVTISNTGKSAITGKVLGKRGRKGKDIEGDVRKWLKKAEVKKMKFKNPKELAKAAAKGQKKYWWMVRPNHQIHELSKSLFKELKK
jgi:hypothetical protein